MQTDLRDTLGVPGPGIAARSLPGDGSSLGRMPALRRVRRESAQNCGPVPRIPGQRDAGPHQPGRPRAPAGSLAARFGGIQARSPLLVAPFHPPRPVTEVTAPDFAMT